MHYIYVYAYIEREIAKPLLIICINRILVPLSLKTNWWQKKKLTDVGSPTVVANLNIVLGEGQRQYFCQAAITVDPNVP